MIAKAITVHKLDQRISLSLLSWCPQVQIPRNIVGIITLNCVLLSAFISNVATTTMMFSIVKGMLSRISEAIQFHQKQLVSNKEQNEREYIGQKREGDQNNDEEKNKKAEDRIK